MPAWPWIGLTPAITFSKTCGGVDCPQVAARRAHAPVKRVLDALICSHGWLNIVYVHDALVVLPENIVSAFEMSPKRYGFVSI